jgi:hypothetical protein
LREGIDARTTVLVKGSRFMQMFRVVEALTGESPGNAPASSRPAQAH